VPVRGYTCKNALLLSDDRVRVLDNGDRLSRVSYWSPVADCYWLSSSLPRRLFMVTVTLKGSSSSALVQLVFQSYADTDADGQQLPTANLYQASKANADIANHNWGFHAI
jgi:hypothetical protein